MTEDQANKIIDLLKEQSNKMDKLQEIEDTNKYLIKSFVDGCL